MVSVIPSVDRGPANISGHIVESNYITWCHVLVFKSLHSNTKRKLLSFPVVEDAEETKAWQEEDNNGHDSSTSSYCAPKHDDKLGGKRKKDFFSLDCTSL